MARFVAVLVLLLMLTPAATAEPSRQVPADHDWIGSLWGGLLAWISGIGACIIPNGSQAEPATGGDTACIGACIIPNGAQAEPATGGDIANR